MDNELLNQLKEIKHSLASMADFLADSVSSSKKGGRPPPKGPKGPYNPGPPLPRAPPLPKPKKPWQPKRTMGQRIKYSGVRKAGGKSPERGRSVSPRSPRAKKSWKKRHGKGAEAVESLSRFDVKGIQTEKAPKTCSEEKFGTGVDAFLDQMPARVPVQFES